MQTYCTTEKILKLKGFLSKFNMTEATNSFLSYQGSGRTVSSDGGGGGTTYPKPQPGDPGRVFIFFWKKAFLISLRYREVKDRLDEGMRVRLIDYGTQYDSLRHVQNVSNTAFLVRGIHYHFFGILNSIPEGILRESEVEHRDYGCIGRHNIFNFQLMAASESCFQNACSSTSPLL
jgi:hypothetical protein